MINNDISSNNFQNFSDSLGRLEQGGGQSSSRAFADVGQQGGQAFQENGFAGAFNGFQENLNQQYAVSTNESDRMVLTFVQVLTELMNNVMQNNLSSEAQGFAAQGGVDTQAAEITEVTKPERGEAQISDEQSQKTSAASCPFS